MSSCEGECEGVLPPVRVSVRESVWNVLPSAGENQDTDQIPGGISIPLTRRGTEVVRLLDQRIHKDSFKATVDNKF